MFRTPTAFEIPSGDLYSGKARLWRVVEHSLHVPWFYTTLSERHLDEECRTMVLLHDLESLSAMIGGQTESRRIVDIYLVSPGYVNQQERWLMEPVAEISVSVQGNVRVDRCVVEGDRAYYFGPSSNRFDPALFRKIYDRRS